MQGSNEMMKEVIREMMHDDKNKWMKTTKVYLDKVGLEMNQATNMTKEELKKHMKQWTMGPRVTRRRISVLDVLSLSP